jgi:hypothetical protein
MNTDNYPVSGDVHEVYVAKINNAIAEGRDALVSSLAADYDQLVRAESTSADRANRAA